MESTEPTTITLPQEINLDNINIDQIISQFVWAGVIISIAIALIICGTIIICSYFKHRAKTNCDCAKTDVKKGDK